MPGDRPKGVLRPDPACLGLVSRVGVVSLLFDDLTVFLVVMVVSWRP